MDIKILQNAESLIHSNRQNAIAKSEKNRDLLMSKPDFCKLNDKYNTILSKAMKSHSNADLLELEKLDKAMLAIADKAKLPLENYSCKICEDKGITADGRRCKCLIKLYRELVINSFELGKPIANAELSSDKLPNSIQNTILTKIYERSKKFVDTFPNTNFKNLIFSGATGVGKTYIVSAIAGRLIERDFDVVFCNASLLNSKFLDIVLGKLPQPDAFINKLHNADLLIIDDLGAEKMINTVTIEKLKTLLDMRANKHTIITTNLDPKEEFKARYGERISSRVNDIKNSFWTDIKGDDLRLKK